MDDFSVHARTSGTQATLAVRGDLDASTAPVLRQRLQAVIADGAKRLVLDLRRVTFIESVALGVIIATRKQLGAGDKSLCIALHPDQTAIRKVLRVTGLDQVLPIYATAEAAEEDCAGDPPAA